MDYTQFISTYAILLWGSFDDENGRDYSVIYHEEIINAKENFINLLVWSKSFNLTYQSLFGMFLSTLSDFILAEDMICDGEDINTSKLYIKFTEWIDKFMEETYEKLKQERNLNNGKYH